MNCKYYIKTEYGYYCEYWSEDNPGCDNCHWQEELDKEIQKLVDSGNTMIERNVERDIYILDYNKQDYKIEKRIADVIKDRYSMKYLGGFINGISEESWDILSGKYRRWVKCLQCGNIFETYAKEAHCLKCGYESCDTILQTING